MTTKKKTIIDKVEEKYGTSCDWVIETGKVAETRMIRDLYLELKKSQAAAEKYHNLCDDKTRDVAWLKIENRQLKEKLKASDSKIKDFEKNMKKTIADAKKNILLDIRSTLSNYLK